MEKTSTQGAINGPAGGGDDKSLSLPAHCLTAEAALRELSTHPENGLSSAEAKARIETYGSNILEEAKGVSVIGILIRQVANAMMLVKPPISHFCLTYSPPPTLMMKELC